MVNYSVVELADIHFIYGKANGNSYKARRFYDHAFSDRCGYFLQVPLEAFIDVCEKQEN